MPTDNFGSLSKAAFDSFDFFYVVMVDVCHTNNLFDFIRKVLFIRLTCYQ